MGTHGGTEQSAKKNPGLVIPYVEGLQEAQHQSSFQIGKNVKAQLSRMKDKD